MLKIPRLNLKRIRNLIVALAFVLLQMPFYMIAPQKVLADGSGSPAACESAPAGSVEGTPSLITYTAPAGNVTTGVCIKSGNNMWGADKHSGVLGNGNYTGNPTVAGAVTNCYSVSGVGTQTVTVTRNADSDACQGLSHIDVLYTQALQSVTPAAVTFNDLCGTVNDTYTIPTSTGVNYQISGSTITAGTYPGTGTVTVNAVAQAGYSLTGTTQWLHTFTNIACEQAVTPAAVTFDDECGTEDDEYTIPTTIGVNYQVAGVTKSAGTYSGTGTVTVTAVAQAGYSLTGTTQWSHTFTNEECEEGTGTITIVKDARPNSTQAFTFTGNLTGDAGPNFQLVDDGDGDGSERRVFNNLEPGTYTATEPNVQGWELTDIDCGESDSDVNVNNRNVVIRLKAGDNVTCTFVNEQDENQPTPAQPTVVSRLVPCVPDSGNNDTVTVTVTNTDDNTNAGVTYTVVLGGQTKTITLADGASGTLTFSGLNTGSYSARVTGNDGTQISSNTVTVGNCPEEGDILGETIVQGGRGGGSIAASQVTQQLADTGTDVIGTLFAAMALIGLTSGLAVPTMKAQYE
jgi:hypothetical protein